MPSGATSRDLVLALVHGYTVPGVRPFFESLRRVAPAARVLVACSEISDETISALRGWGCELLPYRYYRFQFAGRKVFPGNTRWKWFHDRYAGWVDALPGLSPARRRRLRARIMRHFLDINTRRFVEFFLWLETRVHEFDRILLTDVRDVWFQSDPFPLVTGEELVCGLEDEALTIGSQWGNSLWLKQIGGPAALAALSDRRISCCGVVLGSAAAFLEYLGRMVDALGAAGHSAVHFHGADTGAHHLVIYRSPVAPVRWADFRLGGIINLHGLGPEYIRWTEDGLLSDVNGKPFAVVHQYDRHPAVAERLLGGLSWNPG